MCGLCGFEEHLGTWVRRGQLAGLLSHLSAVKSHHADLTVYLFHTGGHVGREAVVVAQSTSGQQASTPWSVLAKARWPCGENICPGWALDSTTKSECFPIWGILWCCDIIKSWGWLKHKIQAGCQLRSVYLELVRPPGLTYYVKLGHCPRVVDDCVKETHMTQSATEDCAWEWHWTV